jgi:hypothetical protein
MADTQVRIGSGGPFPRPHAVEPNSKTELLRQYLAVADLVTTIGAP